MQMECNFSHCTIQTKHFKDQPPSLTTLHFLYVTDETDEAVEDDAADDSLTSLLIGDSNNILEQKKYNKKFIFFKSMIMYVRMYVHCL